MRKVLIVALVCVNVALLAALMLGLAAPRASAQVDRGGADYLMMTGQIGRDWDAVYVVDMGSRRLMAWRFDQTKKRLVAFRGRELKTDFARKEGE